MTILSPSILHRTIIAQKGDLLHQSPTEVKPETPVTMPEPQLPYPNTSSMPPSIELKNTWNDYPAGDESGVSSIFGWYSVAANDDQDLSPDNAPAK